MVFLTIVADHLSLVAYWDQDSCGPNGDDYNWQWCDERRGGPCKGQVSTDFCPSGIASLKEVHGNQYATHNNELQNYQLNGCNYAYYATYECTGKNLKAF